MPGIFNQRLERPHEAEQNGVDGHVLGAAAEIAAGQLAGAMCWRGPEHVNVTQVDVPSTPFPGETD